VINLPEIATSKIVFKLNPKAEVLVKKGHPWIFEGSIESQKSEGKAGDLVIMFDSRHNKFLACGLYDPISPIRIKILQANKAANINEDWFKSKIEAAYNIRKPLQETDTNSYRLIYGENDGLPGFIADVYNNVLVVKLYSETWFPYLKLILPQLVETSKTETLVLRLSRNLQSTAAKYELTEGQVLHGELKNEVVVFKEHGINFSANVIHGHKTGYFLDHRNNRKRVGELSKGKKVLDVFSYAGGFSVHALTGGAAEVVSLDISKQALEMAKENAKLNEYSGEHTTLAVDAFKGLEELIDNGETYDIVVIDPPSFAKRKTEVETAKKQYARLAKLGALITKKGGTLILASCSSRVQAQEFFDINENTFGFNRVRYQTIDETYHDIDHPISFPEGAYLKCGYYKIG
jgi:23S rRNA (cytosine1962-C5)-methyltransferase